MPVDSDALADRYRKAIFDAPTGSVLVSRISGSEQEADLTVQVNGNGFGRVRHFKRRGSPAWPENPLPIDPAAKALGLGFGLPQIEAQVFQNAACNWRCWYCFVPFSLLRADRKRSEWLSAKGLVDSFLAIENRPVVLDLSGGQPELTPEWVLTVMDELERRDVSGMYLWSDDNLSTDFFWRYLSVTDQKRIATFPNYGRVCCFKGFDEESFAFNTAASPTLFERQFNLMARYVGAEMNVYAYVTLTSPHREDLSVRVERFLDRLQRIHVNLPLRTVPLEVQVYSPVESRMNPGHTEGLKVQHEAVEIWKQQLEERFSYDLRCLPITEISLA
jgi:uncharacterized Fe-S cluster-containing radical SAM superfamily protein